MSVEGTYLTIDKQVLKNLYKNSDQQLTISIPQFAKASVEITLNKVQLLGDNFYVSNPIWSRKAKVGLCSWQLLSKIQRLAILLLSPFLKMKLTVVITIDGAKLRVRPYHLSKLNPMKQAMSFIMNLRCHYPIFECETDESDLTSFSETNSALVNSLV